MHGAKLLLGALMVGVIDSTFPAISPVSANSGHGPVSQSLILELQRAAVISKLDARVATAFSGSEVDIQRIRRAIEAYSEPVADFQSTPTWSFGVKLFGSLRRTKAALVETEFDLESSRKFLDPDRFLPANPADQEALLEKAAALRSLIVEVQRLEKKVLEPLRVLGDDDRTPVKDIPPTSTVYPGLAQKSQAVVAIVRAPGHIEGHPLILTQIEKCFDLGAEIGLRPPCLPGSSSTNSYAEQFSTKEFIGTGFICEDTRLVVTAGHVVNDATPLDATAGSMLDNGVNGMRVVLNYSPSRTSYPPELVRIPTKAVNYQKITDLGKMDIGVMQIRPFKQVRAPLKLAVKSEKQCKGYSLGFPFGWNMAVNRPRRVWDCDGYSEFSKITDPLYLPPKDILWHELSQNVGQSGAPVFDSASGTIVGLCQAEYVAELPFLPENGCAKIMPCAIENRKCRPNVAVDVRAIRVAIKDFTKSGF